MEWIEISMIVERVVADEVTTLFTEFMDTGITEEPCEAPPTFTGEAVRLGFYTPRPAHIEGLMADMKGRMAAAGFLCESMAYALLPADGWQEQWKEYVEPRELCESIVCCPIWKDYEPKEDECVLHIDSKLAFGTGAHETTRACARLLKAYGRSGDRVLDIGTGTGILLIVAGFLGMKDLVAVDIDGEAVVQARENCARNGIVADVREGDLDKAITESYDLVLANLTVDPLKLLLPSIKQKVADGGTLIISGIHEVRYEEIMPYITRDWRIVATEQDGPWYAMALQKK